MLQLAPDFSLPIDAVTEKLALLGRTGSGKSYAAMKTAEQMLYRGAQIVAVDPVGVWWGLRVDSNGEDPGIDIPVFGGLHGDIPLDAGAGRMVADLIVDRGISVVLDVSQFESDAAKARFATDFADRLYFRKKAAPSAIHLFLEEAQEFVPQNPQREEARMLHAFTRMWKIGRNFGIGGSLISQRPQEVNKKVLNQTELLFAFQMTGPQERKTIAGWIAEKGIDEDVAGILPKLERGAPHIWSPSWLKVSAVIRIAPRSTFDASSTPRTGKRATARQLAPIDLDKIRADMAATIERAKAEDPKELKARLAAAEASTRKRIHELEQKLAAAEKVKAPPAAAPGADLAQLSDWARRLQGLSDGIAGLPLTAMLTASKGLADEVRRAERAASRRIAGPAVTSSTTGTSSSVTPSVVFTPARRIPAPLTSAPRTNGSAQLAAGEGKILSAIAMYPEGATREQLTVLTGYKRSSRDTYLQRLRAAGYVDVDGDRLTATSAGVAALGDSFQALPTGADLRAYWLERLPEGERRVLEPLIEAFPNAVSRDELDGKTGYKRSSRDTYLQRLAQRRLITTSGRGEVRASGDLF